MTKDEITKLILTGTTEKELAIIFNTTESKIRTFKKNNGILSKDLNLPGMTAHAKKHDLDSIKQMILDGKTNKQIADILEISESSIDRLIKNNSLRQKDFIKDLTGFVDIREFPSYMVNISGVVIRKSDKRILKQFITKGYPAVSLINDSDKNINYMIHRLVAFCFIPNPLNLPIINHKDGDKTNFKISNLEWCTYTQNSQHAVDTGRVKYKNGTDIKTCKLTEDNVKDIKNLIKQGLTCAQIKTKLNINVSEQTIGKIRNGKTWKYLK